MKLKTGLNFITVQNFYKKKQIGRTASNFNFKEDQQKNLGPTD